MIKQYDGFLNENRNSMYRLYIEEDAIEDVNWDLSLNISDLWDSYKGGNIGIETFIKKYKYKINEYKSIITNRKGVDVWNELVLILNDFKSYESITMHKKLDEVYDWADKNNIEILT